MKVYLYRHGKTKGNLLRKYIGRTDEPLCEEGKAELKKNMIEPRFVYVTPLRRTQQTAEILFPKAERVIVDNLREIDFGDFEGRAYLHDLQFDEDYQKWVDSNCEGPIPNGEQKCSFSARVVDSFTRLARISTEDPIVLVVHGGTIMSILDAFSDPHKDYYEWNMANGRGFCGDFDGRKFTNIEPCLC